VTTRATTPTPSSTAATGGALDLTLAPVSAEKFLADHWDRRPLLVSRREPGRFDEVLSTADAEAIALAGGTRTPAFRLVKDGAQLPTSTYTENIPWRPTAFTGTAVPRRVADEFAKGATLVLQGLHHHWHPAAAYCRGLEAALGCPVQANAYWTPSSAQGFDVHHDTHDVFVLQLAGHKRWRVYEPVLELPLKSQRWSADLGEVGEPVMDFVLGPGDTLYMPRGWPHEAETSGDASLHLTVGLHPPSRLDALRAALDACAEDVEFRRALAADGELPDDLLDRLAERMAPEDVAARARRRFVDTRRPILPDQLTQLAALTGLTAGSLLERRPTVIADLEAATLRFEGRELEFPPQARTAIAAIHAHEGPFTAADLPGPLDDPGRLVLLRRLVREGYLRIVA
jgi:ribosomal protein L16 Arg81 hydroxylase